MKILFFGSSEFSLSALQACLKNPCEVSGVITTPPQKQGRGLKEVANPIKQYAQSLGLPLFEPATLKDESMLNLVKPLAPDLIVVSSYGKLIPSSWLALARLLCLNVHPSLLPKYRGAAPIQRAILHGEVLTGISIAEVTTKLDAGDIFYQEPIPINPATSSLELEKILAEKSKTALQSVFSAILSQSLQRTPQNETQATYAGKLKKEEGTIDWTRSAKDIHNQIRGLVPWPMAVSQCRGNSVQMILSRPLKPDGAEKKPGEIVSIQKPFGFEIQTGCGTLLIEKLKPAGKKEMAAVDFINGARLLPGMCFDL